ncbi:hypothetical protein [Micromonospora sp. NPDC049801]
MLTSDGERVIAAQAVVLADPQGWTPTGPRPQAVASAYFRVRHQVD